MQISITNKSDSVRYLILELIGLNIILAVQYIKNHVNTILIFNVSLV